ncbi:hypothetical protein MMC26_001802 [Xylographa opegraphella]|nr:hypothetical protein [Xylographa opegraphella]
MLLASYEVYEGSLDGQRGAAWISHVRGASQMIALRGTHGKSSPFAALLQHAARYNELIVAISTRREVPERPLDVLSGLSLHQTASKEMELYEVLSRLPGLLAAAENLPELRPRDVRESCMARLVTSHQNFQARLDLWLNSVQAQYDGPLYWLEPSELYAQLPESSLERVFPQCIQFLDLSVAHMQLLYWTAQLLLKSVLSVTCQILGKGDNNIDLINTFAIEVDEADSSVCHDLACKIAQSVECLTRTEAGLVGAQVLGFPMSCARGCLHLLKSRDIIWFNVIFRRLSVLDIRLEGFLNDMTIGPRDERIPRQLLHQ